MIRIYLVPDGIIKNSDIDSYFEGNDMFDVIRPDFDRSKIEINAKETLHREEIIEREYFYYCLNDAVDYNDIIVIVKDNMMTYLTPRDLYNYLNDLRKLTFDIAYLSRWHDQCDKDISLSKYIVQPYAPNGVQALALSREGREILLRKKNMANNQLFNPYDKSLNDALHINVAGKNLQAIAFSPNLFALDRVKAEVIRSIFIHKLCLSPGGGRLYQKQSWSQCFIISFLSGN